MTYEIVNINYLKLILLIYIYSTVTSNEYMFN